MKKFLALMLTVLLVTGSFALAAPAAGADGIDDHLVVHYDFEGDTKEEILSDKAPAGTANNLVEWYSNSADATGGKITYENGTVKATSSGGYLHTVGSNTDVAVLGGPSTLFIRYKIPSAVAYTMVDVYNTTMAARQAQVGLAGTAINSLNVIGGYFTSTSSHLAYQVGNSNALAYRVLNQYVNLAIVYNPTKTISSTTDNVNTYAGLITYYASVGMPGTWVQIGTKTPTNTDNSLSESSDNIRLSLLGTVTGGSVVNGLVIDDFRIYDTMLTTDQLTEIIDTGSFDCHYNTMEVVGAQIAKENNSTDYAVRFIGTIDTLDATSVGFKVTATYNNGNTDVVSDEKTYTATTVYTSILADNTTISPYSSWQSKYLAVLPIQGIPDSYGNVTFSVTPVTVVDGNQVLGTTQTYTFNAGVLVEN